MSNLKIHDLEIAMEMGFRDYKDKKAHTDCPYALATLRVAWEEGWEEAQLADFFPIHTKPNLRIVRHA
jgi:ribosome modulation factor